MTLWFDMIVLLWTQGSTQIISLSSRQAWTEATRDPQIACLSKDLTAACATVDRRFRVLSDLVRPRTTGCRLLQCTQLSVSSLLGRALDFSSFFSRSVPTFAQRPRQFRTRHGMDIAASNARRTTGKSCRLRGSRAGSGAEVAAAHVLYQTGACKPERSLICSQHKHE